MIAANLFRREGSSRDIEMRNLRVLLRHQGYLHVVRELELRLQRLPLSTSYNFV